MKTWCLKAVASTTLAFASFASFGCGDKNAANQAPCKTGANACFCYPNHTCDTGSSCFGNLCLDQSLGAFAGSFSAGQGGGALAGAGGTSGESGATTGGTGGNLSSSASGSGNAGGMIGTPGGGGAHAVGGSFGTAGSSAAAGSGASAGSGAVVKFPPDPSGCALVASCPTCCATTGVFALDALANDATARFVTAFEVSGGAALAEFDFTSSDQVGAIFFRFSSAQKIGSLSITGAGTGGAVEVALVRAVGKDGCIYPVIAGTLSPTPNSCWGLGAGPFALLPADQIEIRVRSLGPGRAALSVAAVEYGP